METEEVSVKQFLPKFTWQAILSGKAVFERRLILHNAHVASVFLSYDDTNTEIFKCYERVPGGYNYLGDKYTYEEDAREAMEQTFCWN